MPFKNLWRDALVEDWRHGGFGLYVHWPFCEAKCPYCDFNSHVSNVINHDDWRNAFIQEIDRVARLVPGRRLDSIYFGGGTPSLMEPRTVAAVIERARHHWPGSNAIEITLEANPSSVEQSRFSGFADAGVNRVSLGVQALNPQDLKRLGRVHSESDALAALDIALRAFDRVSFDLIYARQDQSLTEWEEELTRALSFGSTHMSLYQLTIEPETAFGARHRAGKLRGLPQEDLAADMYTLTQELCSNHGLPAYEVSNHAAVGDESRHNLIYWRGGDYAGIGPGAHGRLTLSDGRYATETHLAPGQWLKAVSRGNGESQRLLLTKQDVVGELIMMALRTNEGLDIDRVRSFDPTALPDQAINPLVEVGVLTRRESTLSTTAAGRMVLNSVISALLPE